MNKLFVNLCGVLSIGLTWFLLWAAVGAIILAIIGIMRPDNIGAGEGPLVLSRVIGLAGFICGVAFGGLLFLVERRKSILDFSLGRAAIWGFVVTAALFLLAGKDLGMLLFIGPLSVFSAVVSVTLLRIWDHWHSAQPPHH